jgi:hypothetical protein
LQNSLKQSRTAEQIEAEQNCRTDKSREELQNREEVVRIETPVLLVIQSFIYNQGGRVVLGRTVVLCYSSWCLNTESWSFHLVVARKTGWQGGAWENTEFFVYKLVLV